MDNVYNSVNNWEYQWFLRWKTFFKNSWKILLLHLCYKISLHNIEKLSLTNPLFWGISQNFLFYVNFLLEKCKNCRLKNQWLHSYGWCFRGLEARCRLFVPETGCGYGQRCRHQPPAFWLSSVKAIGNALLRTDVRGSKRIL